MPINIPRGQADATINRMKVALQAYQDDHPNAKIDIYRHNSVSVRVRIVDPAFADTTKVERSNTVWKYLNALAEDDQSDLSTLVLLAPGETKTSFSNIEFEDPTPSSL